MPRTTKDSEKEELNKKKTRTKNGEKTVSPTQGERLFAHSPEPAAGGKGKKTRTKKRRKMLSPPQAGEVHFSQPPELPQAVRERKHTIRRM